MICSGEWSSDVCSSDLVEDVLQGQLADGGQVEGLVDAPHALEDLEGQLRVVHAVPDHLVPVPLPLLVDLLALEVMLPFPEEMLGHVVEVLLFEVEGQPLRLHGPPDVRHDAAVDPPEPLPEVEEVREVPGELELRDAVLLGALHEDGEVVPVDVVPRDDVGVRLLDELHEALDDLLLRPRQDAGLQLALLAVHAPDAQDIPVPDRVLDVEAQDPELGAERLAGLEPVRDDEEVRRVSAPRARPRPPAPP